MPPSKELHYFDRARRYPSLSSLATDRFLERWFSDAPHNRGFRARFRADLRDAWSRGDWKLLRWLLRYNLGSCSDEWYLSLFQQGRGRVCGEITPAYAILEEVDVVRIRRLLPELKVIFILRNPIERAWSHLRFESTQGRFAGCDDLTKIRARSESPGAARRSDYLRTLEIWESQFRPEKIFIGFFDDIVMQPAKLLSEVCTFLGVDAGLGWTSEARLRRKVQNSNEAELPLVAHRYFAQRFLPQLEQLSARFGGHAERWRSEAAAVIAE